jgi:hypothetical protein
MSVKSVNINKIDLPKLLNELEIISINDKHIKSFDELKNKSEYKKIRQLINSCFRYKLKTSELIDSYIRLFAKKVIILKKKDFVDYDSFIKMIGIVKEYTCIIIIINDKPDNLKDIINTIIKYNNSMSKKKIELKHQIIDFIIETDEHKSNDLKIKIESQPNLLSICGDELKKEITDINIDYEKIFNELKNNSEYKKIRQLINSCFGYKLKIDPLIKGYIRCYTRENIYLNLNVLSDDKLFKEYIDSRLPVSKEYVCIVLNIYYDNINSNDLIKIIKMINKYNNSMSKNKYIKLKHQIIDFIMIDYYLIYEHFIHNKNIDNYKNLIENYEQISKILNNNYVNNNYPIQIEIISGDKILSKIKDDINYSSIIYMIFNNFCTEENFNNMFFGQKYDLDRDSLWFILWHKNIIMSVSCFYSKKLQNSQNFTDNVESFCTKKEFYNNGYILMKYIIQYNINNKNNKNKYIIIGIEKNQRELINYYRNNGFVFYKKNEIGNIYMTYKIPEYDIIKFKIPTINTGKINVLLNEVKYMNFEDIYDYDYNKICIYKDKTIHFKKDEYLKLLDNSIIEAINNFESLDNNKKIEYYNVARELSELDLCDPLDGFIKKCYKMSYYMNMNEYNTNNYEVKYKVAKRFYITYYILTNLKMNDRTIMEGINIWNDAYCDIRYGYKNILNKKIKLDVNEKLTLDYMNNLIKFNYLPHCYFNLNYLKSYDTNLDYMMDFNTDVERYNLIFLNPKLSKKNCCDRFDLSEDYLISGLSSVFLLYWEYEDFMVNLGHEYMHTFRYSTSLCSKLFPDLYYKIKTYYTELNEIQQFEILADIQSLSIFSLLLENSINDKEDKIKMLQKSLSAICNGGEDQHHPSAEIRIKSVCIIKFIYDIFHRI